MRPAPSTRSPAASWTVRSSAPSRRAWSVAPGGGPAPRAGSPGAAGGGGGRAPRPPPGGGGGGGGGGPPRPGGEAGVFLAPARQAARAAGAPAPAQALLRPLETAVDGGR